MSTKITKSNADIAWKLYNYLNVWEDKIFGKKSSNNAIYMFILTMVALNNELTLSDIINKMNIEYKEVYRYIDSLVRYHKFLSYDGNTYKISSDFLKSINDSDIKVSEVNEKVFCTLLSNMKYHTQIFQEHLTLTEKNNKFKIMRALMSPVISNPIHASDCRQLSMLGYMKYRPQKKEFMLNEVAYKKDWVGLHVI